MRMGAVAGGALSLIALQVVVTSKQTGRIADLFALPAAWARWLIDPSVPAIADHTKPSSTSPAVATTIPSGTNWSATTI